MDAVEEDDALQQPAVVQNAERKMNSHTNSKEKRRRRRSSSLMYQEPPESLEQQSDQAVLPNLNAQWVNAKGRSNASRGLGVWGRNGLYCPYVMTDFIRANIVTTQAPG